MAALIALQLRIAWRGTPLTLRALVFFLLIPGIHALISKQADQTGLVSIGVAGLAFFLFGAAAASGTAEPITWQVPLPRPVRAWARIFLLVIGGTVHTAIVLGLYRGLGFSPPEGWSLLGANLWFCCVGGGLLLFLASDLTRARHTLLQAIALVLGFVPGTVLWAVHLSQGLHSGFLIGEILAAVGLCWLNLVVNRDLELHARLTVPKGELDDYTRPIAPPLPEPRSSPPAATLDRSTAPIVRSAPSSRRLLDRTPSVTPVLFSSLFSHVWVWILGGLWLVASFIPVAFVHALYALMFLPLLLQGVLNHWQPFQASPLSRRAVFLRLLSPVLGLWALTMVLQGTSIWLSTPPTLLEIERSTPFTEDGQFQTHERALFALPSAKRDPDAAISPQLLLWKSWEREIPQPPEQAAALLSEAFRVSYGLGVPASEILALHPPGGLVRGRDPAQTDWLRKVERRWSPAVRWRHTEWKLLIGVAGLVLSLFSLLSTLRGRCPRWIAISFPFLSATVPMLLLFFYPQGSNESLFLPMAWLRRNAYDHPGLLIAALAALAALLLYRHLRVFSSGEITSLRRKT
jgi:hypothetical protein